MNGSMKWIPAIALVGLALSLTRAGQSDESHAGLENSEEQVSADETSAQNPVIRDAEIASAPAFDTVSYRDEDVRTAAAGVEYQADRITWVGTISSTFDELCVPCHQWGDSYEQVVRRVESGDMQLFLDLEHFISGDDRQHVLRWIEQGYPEN